MTEQLLPDLDKRLEPQKTGKKNFLRLLVRTLFSYSEMPLRFVFGDDIFISYSRADGINYAEGLASKLAKESFSCRVDLWETSPGSELPKKLRRSLRWSKMFVLIGTEAAAKSPNVELEIDEFLLTKGTIVPVEFDYSIQRSNWFKKIEGLPLAREVMVDALVTGKASEIVVSRIQNSFKFTRRNSRIRRFFMLALLALVALGILNYFAARSATRALGDARVAEHAAQLAKEEAALQNKRAEAAADEAKKQARLTEVANANRVTAEKEAKTADDNRKTAEANARHQEAVANERRREAEKQQKVATSRRLIANAELAKNRPGDDRVSLPVSLALEAWQHYPSFEADSLLRYGLDRLPRSIARMNHPNKVQALAFSNDQQSLTTLGADHIARVWNIAENRELANLTYGADASTVLLSLHGRYVACAYGEKTGNNKTAHLFEIAAQAKQTPIALKHDQAVVAFAFSQDEQLLASASADNVVKIWKITAAGPSNLPAPVAAEEAASFKVVAKGDITRLTISPDGKFISVTSTYYSEAADEHISPISVWDVSSGKKLSLGGGGREATMSATGKYLAYVNSDTVWVDESASDGADDENAGRNVLRKVEESVIDVVAFSLDEQFFATGNRAGYVRVYDLDNDGKEVARLDHSAGITYLEFTAWGGEDQFLTTITEDNTAHLWLSDRRSKHLQFYEAMQVHHREQINAIAFSPGGKYVATASDDNTAHVWEKMHGGSVASVPYQEAWGQSVSSNGRYVAVVSADETSVWDVLEKKLVRKIEADFHTYDVMINNHGNRLVSWNGYQKPVRVWNLETGAVSRVGSETAKVVGENSSSGFFAIEDSGKQVHIWNAYDNREVGLVAVKSEIIGITFGPSGKYYSINAKDKMVRIRETETGRDLLDDGQVYGTVTFSPQDKCFAVLGSERDIILYELATKKRLGKVPRLAEVREIIFSADSSYLAVVHTGDVVSLWKNNGQAIKTIKHDSDLREKVFSRSSNYFATAMDDGTVQLFKTANGQQIGSYKHGISVGSLTFTPDERYLATATTMHDNQGDQNENRTVSLWDISTKERVIRMEYQDDIRNLSFNQDGRLLTVIGEHRLSQVLWLPNDVVNEARVRLLEASQQK